MFQLSWSGLSTCFRVLQEHGARDSAAVAIALAEGINPRGAGELLDTAVELNLVIVDTEGHYTLNAFANRPEDLLMASTLVRLFRAWQQFVSSDPLRMLRAPERYFRVLGVEDIDLLRAANDLARNIEGAPDDMPPQAALLLEMARLWFETHQDPSRSNALFRAPDAYAAFHGLLFASKIYPDNEGDALERFLTACRVLSNRNLARTAIVQYAFENNQPYRRFRTQLGYLKALYNPKPFEGLM